MTYQHRSLGSRVRTRRRAAMGNLFDDVQGMIDANESSACRAQADQITAALDGKTEDLAKNWKPTGFYTVDQVQQLVSYAMQVLTQAQVTTTSGINNEPSGSGAIGPLKDLLSNVNRKIAEGATFTNAAATARAQGVRIIDSPGFKTWITYSMSAASAAISGVAYVACLQPWYIGPLASFKVFVDKLWGAAKAIVGVAIQVGEAVLEIPDAVSTWWTIAKWAAVLGAAYLIYDHRDDLMSLVE